MDIMSGIISLVMGNAWDLIVIAMAVVVIGCRAIVRLPIRKKEQ